MITVDQMVQREVMVCLSSLVSTLAQAAHVVMSRDQHPSDRSACRALGELTEQAFELACPVLDYEEAARDAGWEEFTDEFGAQCWRDKTDRMTWAGTAENLCSEMGVDAYEWEVFEHWAVSGWLADKLEEHGEKVDKDFAGMCVWARTCTGQGIASDGVIIRIHAELIKA